MDKKIILNAILIGSIFSSVAFAKENVPAANKIADNSSHQSAPANYEANNAPKAAPSNLDANAQTAEEEDLD